MNPNLGYEPSKALITDEIEREARQLVERQEMRAVSINSKRTRFPKKLGSLQQRHTLSRRR